MRTLEIPAKRLRVLAGLIVVSVGMSLFVWLMSYVVEPAVWFIVGPIYGPILIWVFCSSLPLLLGKPAVELRDDVLVSRASGFGELQIPWSRIKEVKIRRLLNRYVDVEVEPMDEWAPTSNRLMLFMLKRSYGGVRPTVRLPVGVIRFQPAELAQAIEQRITAD